jgi:hypothetical protein
MTELISAESYTPSPRVKIDTYLPIFAARLAQLKSSYRAAVLDKRYNEATLHAMLADIARLESLFIWK